MEESHAAAVTGMEETTLYLTPTPQTLIASTLNLKTPTRTPQPSTPTPKPRV